MPRGGARPGAGRPRKDAAAAKLHGTRPRSSVVQFPGTSSEEIAHAAVPTDEVAMPPGLPPQAKTVWKRQAPFASAAGMLTPATAMAFGMYCRAVVIERRLGSGPEAGGSNHRGMMQRVEAGAVRFGLTGTGRPVARSAGRKADDPFAEFDEAVSS